MDWAHEHGVRPPEYAIEEARRQKIDLCWLDDLSHLSAAAKTCCAARSEHGKACCCCHHDDHLATDSSKVVGSIVVWRAMACGGQSMNWLAAVPTLIAVRLDIADRMPLISWLGAHSSICSGCIADEPVVPPPERA
jgi:hypothetical protein